MDYFTLTLFLLIGSFAGTAAGLLGIGGGIIYVPALFFYLEGRSPLDSHLPVISVSTSLLIILVSSLSALYGHWKNRNLVLERFVYLLLGGICGAVLASILLLSVDSKQFLALLALFQFVMGVKILLHNKKSETKSPPRLKKPVRLYFIGLLSGSVSAFFGVGGGIITVPLLHLWEDYPIAKAIGVSTAFMTLIAMTSFLSYYFQNMTLPPQPDLFGTIYLPAFLAIVPGAFIGARLGANLAVKIDSTLLVKVFGGVLILVALKTSLSWFQNFLPLF